MRRLPVYVRNSIIVSNRRLFHSDGTTFLSFRQDRNERILTFSVKTAYWKSSCLPCDVNVLSRLTSSVIAVTRQKHSRVSSHCVHMHCGLVISCQLLLIEYSKIRLARKITCLNAAETPRQSNLPIILI